MIQCNSDFGPGEIELLTEMGRRSGRPVSVLLLQVHNEPELWRHTLAGIHAANKAGVSMTGQVGCRPIGVMMGLDVTVNPFREHSAYRAIANLPLADQAARLCSDDALRRALIEDRPVDQFSRWMEAAVPRSYELGDPPDYEPDPARSLGARAAAAGGSVWELALDLLCADGGHSLLLHPFENYSAGNLDAIREMLVDPHTICGIGDGGAHVATICDASYPTTLLAHWGRDRSRGEGLPLEFLVNKQTLATASAYGLGDRGAVKPGLRADLNIVDFDSLAVTSPTVQYDLPAGGRRLVQRSTGYAHTFVAGVEVARDGEHTGALPGRLLRGGT
jgi:N-acyl-D-aspartate/D-glutamate deacylase